MNQIGRWGRWLSLVVVAGLLGACAGGDEPGASGAGAESQRYEWKLITTWPKNLPALGTAPEKLAELVDRMSNGRLKIKVYGAGELVGAFEVFDAVLAGDAEMGHGAAYYWRGMVPEAAFFTAVPFGLTAQEMNGWLYYGGGLELWQELYAPFGLIPFPGGNTGTQMGGWFNKEIKTLADVQGLRMRIPGLGGEVFQRAGGVPVAMPGGDMYTALQTGTIDATDWVGPYNDLAFGLHTVAEYYYYPGWQEPGAVMETLVNKEAFEALPDDLQAIIEVATRAINEDMLAEYTARNNAALRELVNKHGVKVRPFPEDVLAKLRDVSNDVLVEMGRDSPMAERIHASFTSFSADVKAWTAIAEQGYLDARRATD